MYFRQQNCIMLYIKKICIWFFKVYDLLQNLYILKILFPFCCKYLLKQCYDNEILRAVFRLRPGVFLDTAKHRIIVFGSNKVNCVLINWVRSWRKVKRVEIWTSPCDLIHSKHLTFPACLFFVVVKNIK